MIELPESRTLAKQIEERFKGREITFVQAAFSPHGFAFFTGDPAMYPQFMLGRKVSDVRSIGGIIEIGLGEYMLTLNDGINPRLIEKGGKIPQKHQLLIGFDDGSHMVCSVQMYGGMQLILGRDHDNMYYRVAVEKPSPLSDAFDFAYFQTLREGIKPTMSVKAFLATEQRIPGLGNGVLQDILYEARLNPMKKMKDVTDDGFKHLFDCVKNVLKEMTELGGRDTEKDLYGKPGGYKTRLSKSTLAYPCPRCGSAIIRRAYLGGNIYYCEGCQGLK